MSDILDHPALTVIADRWPVLTPHECSERQRPFRSEAFFYHKFIDGDASHECLDRLASEMTDVFAAYLPEGVFAWRRRPQLETERDYESNRLLVQLTARWWQDAQEQA